MIRSKLPTETFLEYKKRVIDTKSASFCGAKWYNATIWLGSGQTTSCHHPLPHAINLGELESNPSAIHNTVQKKSERLMMQQGQRPSGCEYCWRIEDGAPDAISDRPYKTMLYSEEELNEAFTSAPEKNVNLRTLEIAFDRTCNFACSYCNPAFSTTWVKDIKTNGPYTNLASDGRNHYTHLHDHSQLYGFTDNNPYVEAFFKWWETDLHKTLRELRITGGEPLMSGHTWKLLDWFKQNSGKSQTKLAINSNLGLDEKKIDEFISALDGIPDVNLYTSCESYGQHAEYIRDGLNYKNWFSNLIKLIKSGRIKQLHVMATINGLCLLSLPEFLEHMMDFKKGWGKDSLLVTLNILRFPSFQSPTVMPTVIREQCAESLEKFLNYYSNTKILHEIEIDHIKRLIKYLVSFETPHEGASSREILQKDFKIFYEQYDARRNKNFLESFPQLEEWYRGL